LSHVFNGAIARRELHGLMHPGEWVDVGTPERLDAARQALAAT